MRIGSLQHVLLSEHEDNTANFHIAFKELKMGLSGFFKDRVYVWPFHKLSENKEDEVVSMIVQLEIEGGRTPINSTPGTKHSATKFKSEDRYIIGVIA